jgi:mitochondrial import inner membrane translocase subunit TIM44
MRSAKLAMRLTPLTRQRPRPSVLRSSVASPRPTCLRRFSEQPRQSETPKAEETQKQQDNQKKEEEEERARNFKDDTSPPPDPNKSPFQVFVDTFKSELSKSRELQESVKALQDESGRIGDSEALRRAKDAYAKAKERSDRAQNLTGQAIKRAANTVGQAATATWESPVVKSGRKVVSSTASSVAKGVSTATEPIRNNETFKAVSGAVGEAIDDGSSSRYGGYRSREERRRLRVEWETKRNNRRVEANPDAGQSIVMHKDSAWREQWNQFREENSAFQSLLSFKRTHYDESDNLLVSGVRNATDWIADTWSGVFAENEVAGVVRRFKEMDPTFNIESFSMELREWIIPEIVDAYVKGDVETLSQWFSEAVSTKLNMSLTL